MTMLMETETASISKLAGIVHASVAIMKIDAGQRHSAIPSKTDWNWTQMGVKHSQMSMSRRGIEAPHRAPIVAYQIIPLSSVPRGKFPLESAAACHQRGILIAR